MNEPRNPVDKIFSRVKKNPVVAVLIVFGSIVIALSTFTDATKNLLELVHFDTRPEINGEWVAEVTYDWENANYTETFSFRGDGDEVHGTASYLGRKRAILEGTVEQDKLRFITTTRVILDSSAGRERIHEYRGRISGDSMEFIMQTTGGSSEHTPIEFVARKLPGTDN